MRPSPITRPARRRAIELLERSVALCDAEGIAIYLTRTLSGLASALAQAGRVAEALPLLERALEASRTTRFEYGLALIVVQLGEACLIAGRHDEAARHAERALSLASERGERADEAWARHLSGHVAAHRNAPDLEGARRWYEGALALAQELGMRPLVAQCHRSLGQLAHAGGRVDDAHAHLSMADQEARAMGIVAWMRGVER